MRLGKRLAYTRSQGPEVLGAKPGIVDPAGILGASRLGRLAGTGQGKRFSNLSAERPPRQAALVRPEHQILDILLAPTVGLQADRRNHAGLGLGQGVKKRQLITFAP